MARKAFTNHPQFMWASQIASDAVVAAANHVASADHLNSNELEARTNKIVDDLTRLLLNVFDKSRTTGT